MKKKFEQYATFKDIFLHIYHNPFAVLVQKNTSPYKFQGRFKFKVFNI